MKMRRVWYPGTAACLFAADQVMKTYVEQNMEKGQEKELSDRVVLRRVHNKGMCLNLLDGRPEVVKDLSLAAAAAVTMVQLPLLFRKGKLLKKAGYGLALAGAWSNTFDRCARGHVVDYIGFRMENEKLSRLTYNLGDFFLAAGGGILAAASLFTGSSR